MSAAVSWVSPQASWFGGSLGPWHRSCVDGRWLAVAAQELSSRMSAGWFRGKPSAVRPDVDVTMDCVSDGLQKNPSKPKDNVGQTAQLTNGIADWSGKVAPQELAAQTQTGQQQRSSDNSKDTTAQSRRQARHTAKDEPGKLASPPIPQPLYLPDNPSQPELGEPHPTPNRAQHPPPLHSPLNPTSPPVRPMLHGLVIAS